MAERVKVWFDPEADFLEVVFSDAPGYMRETENEDYVETPFVGMLSIAPHEEDNTDDDTP